MQAPNEKGLAETLDPESSKLQVFGQPTELIT